MTDNPSLLAEATTLTIESVASAIEASVVAEEAAELRDEYRLLCYAGKLLCDVLTSYAQTSEEDGREVIEQYGTSTNAGGVRRLGDWHD